MSSKNIEAKNLVDHFHSLTGDALLDFIYERLMKYNYFEYLPNITVIIPIVAATKRWALERVGLIVLIEGTEEERELTTAKHHFENLFGELVMLEYSVRGLYRVGYDARGRKLQGDHTVVEYAFTKDGYKALE